MLWGTRHFKNHFQCIEIRRYFKLSSITGAWNLCFSIELCDFWTPWLSLPEIGADVQEDVQRRVGKDEWLGRDFSMYSLWLFYITNVENYKNTVCFLIKNHIITISEQRDLLGCHCWTLWLFSEGEVRWRVSREDWLVHESSSHKFSSSSHVSYQKHLLLPNYRCLFLEQSCAFEWGFSLNCSNFLEFYWGLTG